MSDLVGEPHWYELRIEPETASCGIRDAGKMLHAHERNTTSSDHHLARVGRTNTHHQNNIDVAVDLEENAALFFRCTRERDDVTASKHGSKIVSLAAHAFMNNVLK